MTSAPMAVRARAGQFGPDAYDDWRSADLGTITERLERRLVLRLAGPVNGQRVLDIGCGDGAVSLACWRNGASSAVGCDVDPRMIARAVSEAARHRAPIDYLLADAGHLPFRDGGFDLVTIVTVLAFVAEPAAAMREIARVLSPGGRLVIGDLGKWNLWAASRRLRGWFGTAPMWRAARFRSAQQLRTLARGAGLHVERVCGAIYYPRSTPVARVMAPLDPWLGERTTCNAAFLALRAVKPANQTGQR